jgi:hypothetical protein
MLIHALVDLIYLLQSCLCLLTLPFLQVSIKDTSSEETQSNRGDSSPADSERTTTPNQPDLPPSASRKRPVPEPVAPRASVEAGQAVSPKKARKGLQTSSPSQEASKVITLHTPRSVDETVAKLAKPPATAHEPMVSPSAIPLISGEVSLLRSAHPSLFDAY